MTNRQLAERARQMASHPGTDHAGRRAALCAAVALADTTTPAAARRVLTGWHDGPGDIRTAALALLDDLTQESRP